jgi:integrative and conjugative element protein (TIGR02256 family)
VAEPAPRLYVSTATIERIGALPARPWEVGGWLLGYSDEEQGAIVVTHATPPSRGTPFSIRISGRRHRRYFDQAWSASDGHVTFLGDWHTHPGGLAIPSERDEEAMHQIAADPDFGEGPTLIAIAATGRWRRPASVETRFYILGDDFPRRLHPRLLDQLPPPADRVPAWSWSRG